MSNVLKLLIAFNIIMTIITACLGINFVFSDKKYSNLSEKNKCNYGRGFINISIIILAETIILYNIPLSKIESIIILEIAMIFISILKYINMRYKYLKTNKNINCKVKA